MKHILVADFAKNKKMKYFQIFDQNYGLTPLRGGYCIRRLITKHMAYL